VRVLVAGASGVVGSLVVRRLISDAHEVFGTTRRPERLNVLAAAGASGIVMDALDRESVERAVRETAPDVLIHELTDLAGFDFSGTARLRVEGTRNLVDAVLVSGVTRMIAQSISWAYGPGEVPATEEEPLASDPSTGAPLFPSINSLEAAVLELTGGIVMRYGLFYGPGTWYAGDGPQAANARQGVVMATTAKTSFVHVDDAASATVAALSWPPGVVNIVDDDPTDVNEWAPLYIAAAGGAVVTIGAQAEGRAADNRHARALGWTPKHESWRTSLLDLS
jgi:nucleoside-diphosphate-sugar epimerase